MDGWLDEWMDEWGIKILDLFQICVYWEESGELWFCLVTFIVNMHVFWPLPEEYICGLSGIYNQGRNGWKVI